MAIQPRGVALLNRTIAEHIGVPPTYLAKVLQNLCRSNLLYSFRGKQGGFCLRERGKEINLMQMSILPMVQDLPRNVCWDSKFVATKYHV